MKTIAELWDSAIVFTQAQASCPFGQRVQTLPEDNPFLAKLLKLLMAQPDVEELSVSEDQIQDAV